MGYHGPAPSRVDSVDSCFPAILQQKGPFKTTSAEELVREWQDWSNGVPKGPASAHLGTDFLANHQVVCHAIQGTLKTDG
mmetsp:Transcript_48048/g.59102  ORF Transcript_48048/g.59102 Transcript_48048/m.59102 type:complete len:80 (+) Transcript_48048:83-322(+)